MELFERLFQLMFSSFESDQKVVINVYMKATIRLKIIKFSLLILLFINLLKKTIIFAF